MFKCCTKANSEDSKEAASEKKSGLPPSSAEKVNALPSVEVNPPATVRAPSADSEPARKPSVGILRKKTSFCEENRVILISREEDQDDVEQPPALTVDCDLANADAEVEPPRTPVGKDELALRRHRFFSELLTAAQSAIDHKPLSPEIADLGTVFVYFRFFSFPSLFSSANFKLSPNGSLNFIRPINMGR